MESGSLIKIFLYPIFILFFVPNVQSQDIRNCKWKMTPRQVIATEKGVFIGREEGALLFRVTADGNTYSITYFFQNDSLVQAVMLYEAKHTNPQTYYEKFKSIKTSLSSKYGKPSDETVWFDDLFKDDPKKYGLAASSGDVKFIFRFKTKRTIISLALGGDNFKCNMGIIYRDINYQPDESTEL